jgi:hypothetical protein
MTEDPTNLMLQLLRDIRQEQSRQLSVIEAQSRSTTNRFEVLEESTSYVRGLAAHGQVRHDVVDRRIDELEARVAKLESRQSV